MLTFLATAMLVVIALAPLLCLAYVEWSWYRQCRRSYDALERDEDRREARARAVDATHTRQENPWRHCCDPPRDSCSWHIPGVARYARIHHMSQLTVFGWRVYLRFGEIRVLFGFMWKGQ